MARPVQKMTQAMADRNANVRVERKKPVKSRSGNREQMIWAAMKTWGLRNLLVRERLARDAAIVVAVASL